MASDSLKTKAAREHIEDIRRKKFSIGAKCPNPLTKDLHNAVTRLSSELYTKDVHFLMELIQNAEDNEYLGGVQPTLEFLFTKEDITCVGAPATLLVFNNEVGFSKSDIESLCSIGQSTKKGKRCQGYIGEKGIGFKSVFLISAQPYIFSNGYQICFSEVPNGDCGIGYIVPEWINAKPSLFELKNICGNSSVLPTTVIILPLKTEKVEAVKKELSQIHPEVLLFLRKIKRVSVKEHCSDASVPSALSAISISTESKLVPRNSQATDSRIVQITVHPIDSDITGDTCKYYIYKQAFPVIPEYIFDQRNDIKQWEICLAFPLGNRLTEGSSAIGIFAFLPTAMVTNFPFIIHSDFVLASSREAILFDNKWNIGILEYVASTFIGAIHTCLGTAQTSELISIPHILKFFPANESPFEQLNKVRRSIKLMVQEVMIVPCEPFRDGQKTLCSPANAHRILPEFRDILVHLKQDGLPFDHLFLYSFFNELYYDCNYILDNSVDNEEYGELWDFLELPSAFDYDWYARCISDYKLFDRASDDICIQLIVFLVDNSAKFPLKYISRMPLLKYVNKNGDILSCSSLQIKKESLKLCLVWDAKKHSWTKKWNLEMGCPNNMFFLTDELVTAFVAIMKRFAFVKWLTGKVGVVIYDVYTYSLELVGIMRSTQDLKLVVKFVHFLYHSVLKNYVDTGSISKILQSMPIVDRSGSVNFCTPTLVPASEGKWVKLFGSSMGFELGDMSSKEKHDLIHHLDIEGTTQSCGRCAELGNVYLEAANFAGEDTAEKEVLNFLLKHARVFDLPHLQPPDVALEVASGELTSDQGLLLLEWIKNLRTQTCSCPTSGRLKKYEIPARFSESIRRGKWLKTYIGFRSPEHCFLNGGSVNKTILDLGRAIEVLSAIDEVYYFHGIRSYQDELIFIGVQIRNEDIAKLIIHHVEPLTSTKMSKDLALLILDFVRYLRGENKFDGNLKKCLQEGKWLKNLQGYGSPMGSIYLTPSTERAIYQIADVPIIDRVYYGSKLECFQVELNSLGVIVNFEEVCELIPAHFRFPRDLSSLTEDSVLMLFKCMKFNGPGAFNSSLNIHSLAWMKTNTGLRCPKECLLSDSRWEYLSDVVSFPVIDESYYGTTIRSYMTELQAIGVIVDLESAKDEVIKKLKSLISSFGFTSTQLLSLLKFLRYSWDEMPSLVSSIVCYLSGESWVKTKLGTMHPSNSILFDADWASISHLAKLPIIDEGFYGDEIYSFRDEFKMLGVIVDISGYMSYVARSLEFPEKPQITAETSISLLQYVASLFKSEDSSDKALLEDLLQKFGNSQWLKTHMGYKFPHETLLFDMEWECSLKEIDGPFIDRDFYRNFTSEENDVLIVLGAKTRIQEVCNLLFKNLTSRVRTLQVKRIYRFLQKYQWTLEPEDNLTVQIWIPERDVCGFGKWVPKNECVIHVVDNLFTNRLHVLDKYYEPELLPFFSHAFGVAHVPDLHQYLDLYKSWLEINHQMTDTELNRFWAYIAKISDWDLCNWKAIGSSITMLPAVDASGRICLMKKEELLIPDDLLLKRAFMESSHKLPLFVWFPKNGFSSPSRLLEVYIKLGVRKLSESVGYLVCGDFQKMNEVEKLIRKPLIKIVLAFLSSSQMMSNNIPTEVKHAKAKSLIHISAYETDSPLMVRYFMLLSPSTEILLHKKVFWDKNTHRLLVHKPSWRNGQEDIQLVSDFSRAIAEAILPNSDDGLIFLDLYRLIKMGFALGFKENKIDDWLITENVDNNLSVEDKLFLDAEFAPLFMEKEPGDAADFPILIINDDNDEEDEDFPIPKVEKVDNDEVIDATTPLSNVYNPYPDELVTTNKNEQVPPTHSKKRLRLSYEFSSS